MTEQQPNTFLLSAELCLGRSQTEIAEREEATGQKEGAWMKALRSGGESGPSLAIRNREINVPP